MADKKIIDYTMGRVVKNIDSKLPRIKNLSFAQYAEVRELMLELIEDTLIIVIAGQKMQYKETLKNEKQN